MYLPVGYHGAIHDPDTGLVHFNRREELSSSMLATSTKTKTADKFMSIDFYDGAEYDPAIGQWTSSSIADLKNAEINPFYPYQVIDPINFHPLFKSLTKTSSWLEALGFQLDNIVPDSNILFQANVSEYSFLHTVLFKMHEKVYKKCFVYNNANN